MSNLIPMDEAAVILGMSVDEVAELRSNNELFGYRDGSTWKFKMSELERVADDLGLKLNAPGVDAGIDSVKNKIDDAVSELGLSLDDSSEELVLQEPDSVEYMEDSSVELLASELNKPVSESGSFKDSSIKVQDLELLSDDDDGLDLEDSGLLTEGVMPTSGSDKESDSGTGKDSGNSLSLDGDDDEMNLSGSSIFDGDEALSFGSSSLKLAGEKSKKSGSDTGDLLDDEPSGKGSPSDTGKEGGGGDDLLLGDDDLFSDDLSLEDSASFEDSADLSSDFEESDSVELLESDSSAELVLDDNDEGVSLAANESGISLSSDQPLELGGSDIDALDLGEDDDMIVLEDAAGPDEATQLKGDDFNLTPLEEGAEAAIEASGSQVVALENSDIYADEGEATILGDAEFEEADGLVDVDDDGFGLEDDYGSTAVAAAGAGGAVVVEAPYNKWQVISLGLVAAFLSTGGMVAYDLARNMWTPENQTLGRGVLKFFLGLTGMDG